MKTVNMHDAKSSLSRLVREVSSGIEAEVVIAIDGSPAVRIVPLAPGGRRLLGVDRGLVSIGENFEARDDEIAALFEGREG